MSVLAQARDTLTWRWPITGNCGDHGPHTSGALTTHEPKGGDGIVHPARLANAPRDPRTITYSRHPLPSPTGLTTIKGLGPGDRHGAIR